MESSSEDAATVVDDDGHQSSSYYVKTMLADAMGEEEPRIMPARDHSPISSERLEVITLLLFKAKPINKVVSDEVLGEQGMVRRWWRDGGRRGLHKYQKQLNNY